MKLSYSSQLSSTNDWSGTASELVTKVKILMGVGLPGLEAPSLRAVRLWRTKGLLSTSGGRRFTGRQILESLAIATLQARGWSLAAIADLLPQLDGTALVSRLSAGASAEWGASSVAPDVATPGGTPRADETAFTAAVLLAQAALKIYDRVLAGREIVRQNDSLPAEMHKAMCLIGKLYIEEGKDDRAGCVHDLLDRARFPLGDPAWGLAVFAAPRFRFRDAILIDPDLRVPTQDAITIATSGGHGIDDIIETQLHARLRETTDRLGPGRNRAYAKIREFVARHSLASETEIREWFELHKLSAIQHVVDDLYDRLPEAWLISGLANKCAWCGTLLRPHPDKRRFPDGKCPLRQCATKRDARAGSRLNPDGLFICRPQVLMYWSGPAVDELVVYDAALQAGLDPDLYPDGDRCDISIGRDKLGIDVKCYTSPISLALRLNSSIGGLISYRRRIVGVPNDLAGRPGYLDSLQGSLDRTKDAKTLEIRSIGSLLQEFREGNLHA